MSKEVHIDIGGGIRADYFVLRASVDEQGIYVVLDPRKFHCAYPLIYPNLHLVRWAASEKGDWKLPFVDSSVSEANMNFISDFMDWAGDGKAYDSIIESLKKTLKPNGVVYIREPNGTIRFLAERFEEHGFQVTRPIPIERDETETSVNMREMSKDSDGSVYFPMIFEARLS
ncbi:MAG: hypothetical protein Q7S45_00675 [Candidatus Curtissbacteria bacterium]|nr:hypothetical protein [Candidatus Curtissbacteria bacterium]